MRFELGSDLERRLSPTNPLRLTFFILHSIVSLHASIRNSNLTIALLKRCVSFDEQNLPHQYANSLSNFMWIYTSNGHSEIWNTPYLHNKKIYGFVFA